MAVWQAKLLRVHGQRDIYTQMNSDDLRPSKMGLVGNAALKPPWPTHMGTVITRSMHSNRSIQLHLAANCTVRQNQA